MFDDYQQNLLWQISVLLATCKILFVKDFKEAILT